MRLLETEKKIIANTILSHNSGAKVYPFGSRTYMTRKGGDIDILIISDKIQKVDLTIIKWEFFKFMHEQKYTLDNITHLFKSVDLIVEYCRKFR